MEDMFQNTEIGRGWHFLQHVSQLNGRTRLTSLDEEAAVDEENGSEIFEFHDVLSGVALNSQRAILNGSAYSSKGSMALCVILTCLVVVSLHSYNRTPTDSHHVSGCGWLSLFQRLA